MNIHFSEIFLILLVALLVIKPERLPEVAFSLGQWLKRLQTVSAKIKSFIEQPVNMGKYSFHSAEKKDSVSHE